MGGSAWVLPVVWAQAASTSTAATSANPNALAPLALRRWCASLTLCSPETVPSLFGVWVWLAGLGALFLLAAAFQGPRRALRQLFDVPGQARLTADAFRRLRRSGRVLAAVIGTTVLAWTGSQSLTYNRSESRDDLLLLTRSRGLGELAVEQGAFSALTPFRDVASLGANLPLLAAATLVVFRISADAWGGNPPPPGKRRRRPSGWAGIAWCCGGLLILYRLISVGSGNAELPLGGCLMVEAVVVPFLMAVCDGLLLGWVLSELRDASSADTGGAAIDPHAAVGLLPATALACVAAVPGRYLATALLLASYYFPSSVGTSAVGAAVRWQLGRGLADLQAAALLTAGLAGAVAWGGGGLGAAVRDYGRMLATQGGRLVATIATAGLAAGAVSAAAYLIVLSLPTATWVLNAADSYAHYATLLVGLWALAALVELGERALPEATLLPVAAPAPAEAEAAYAGPLA